LIAFGKILIASFGPGDFAGLLGVKMILAAGADGNLFSFGYLDSFADGFVGF